MVFLAVALAAQSCDWSAVNDEGDGDAVASGPPPSPEILFTASPMTVAEGVSSTLTWTASYATSCEASGDWAGPRPLSGSVSTRPLSSNSTYTLSCSGAGGSASRTVVVTVTGSAEPPTVALTASPSSTVPGGSVSLTWTSTNAASCAASGGWTGDRPPSGTESAGSLSVTTTYALNCKGPAGSSRSTAVVEVRAAELSARFPLVLSPNNRALVDPNGTPFLINGDTPWSLMVALTDAEVTQYLDDRAGRGFNTILLNLIEHQFAPSPPRNIYDVAPFKTPEDIRTPNDTYFDRCAGIVQQALDRHILVMMTPAYLGFLGGAEGWWQALASRTASEVQDYGAYLGEKFQAFPNIIWVMGGDYWDPQVLTRTRALVKGLKSTGREDWLFTYHPGPNTSSSEVVGSETWLDLNATYAYEDPGLLVQLEQDYGRTPTRPFFLFESRYEQEPEPPVSRLTLRAQAYWSILTGGMGALFGNNPVWNFENKALFPYNGTWETNLDSDGAQDRTRFVDFFQGYEWASLEPDRKGTVLIGGQSTGASSAYAAKSSDSKLVIAYTPSQRQLTIDMTEFSETNVRARWFAPASASNVVVGTFPDQGSRSFIPPATGDWVLLLEAAGR